MMAFIEISYSADISANDVNSRLGKFKQFEMMGFQRIMKISYTELTTNEYVWWTIDDMAGPNNCKEYKLKEALFGMVTSPPIRQTQQHLQGVISRHSWREEKTGKA